MSPSLFQLVDSLTSHHIPPQLVGKPSLPRLTGHPVHEFRLHSSTYIFFPLIAGQGQAESKPTYQPCTSSLRPDATEIIFFPHIKHRFSSILSPTTSKEHSLGPTGGRTSCTEHNHDPLSRLPRILESREPATISP